MGCSPRRAAVYGVAQSRTRLKRLRSSSSSSSSWLSCSLQVLCLCLSVSLSFYNIWMKKWTVGPDTWIKYRLRWNLNWGKIMLKLELASSIFPLQMKGAKKGRHYEGSKKCQNCQGPLWFENGVLTRKLNWAHYLINLWLEREYAAEIVLSFQYDKLVTTWDFERHFVFLARISTHTNEDPWRGIPFEKDSKRQEPCVSKLLCVHDKSQWLLKVSLP